MKLQAACWSAERYAREATRRGIAPEAAAAVLKACGSPDEIVKLQGDPSSADWLAAQESALIAAIRQNGG